MKTGKLSESVLKRTVIKEIQYKNKAVKQGAATGNDSAVFAGCAKDMASSVATYCGEMLTAGRRAFAGAVNSVAAKGAGCFAVQVSIFMPESVKENVLRSLMVMLNSMGEAFKIQVAGGHTETSGRLSVPVVSAVAYGYLEQGLNRESERKLQEGADIVMIGEAGLEGTAVLALERGEELKKRFADSYVDRAKSFLEELVFVKEAAAAVRHGGTAMHNISKGGVFSALWELGEYLGCGMNIDLKSIPIRQETVELCECFDLNPYYADGSGLLAVCYGGEALVNALKELKGQAYVIGRTEPGHQRTVIYKGEKRYLESPRAGRKEAAYF